MAMTFDATLKDLGRDCPQGVLSEFDQPPTRPVSVLNVDLSTVTKSADLVLGLGEPLEEIVHVEFQSSAAAWKHADLVAYNALLFDHHHVPVHTILVLLRPQAAHPNTDGQVTYSPRPGRRPHRGSCSPVGSSFDKRSSARKGSQIADDSLASDGAAG